MFDLSQHIFQPTLTHFYDLYVPHALFLYLDTTKIIDKKFNRKYIQVVPIDREESIYDVTKLLIEKNIFSERFRLRVIQVDANPYDSLVTPTSNVADYGCIETIIFLVEERESKNDAWPSHNILEGNEAEFPKVVFSRVTGLVNLGQTCYLNVVLQLFADIKCMEFLRSLQLWNSGILNNAETLLPVLSQVYNQLCNDKEIVSPEAFKVIITLFFAFIQNNNYSKFLATIYCDIQICRQF